MSTAHDVVVVGAGISGLAAADTLRRAGRSVTVLEAADSVGGRMRTHRADGYVMDTGAEVLSVAGYDATWRLIRRTGLGPAETTRIPHPVATWRDGRVHGHVGAPRALLSGGGLSLRGRASLARFMATEGRRRAAYDPDLPERTPLGTLTLAEYARGYRPELHDFLFQPIAGCFFGWDTARSAAAPFVTNMLACGSTARWRSYTDGMDTLARHLARTVDVTTGCAVREVLTAAGHARVVTDTGTLTARAVLLCVPAPVALRLHVNAPEAAVPYLAACGYVPRLKVSYTLDRPLAPRGGESAYAVLLPAAAEPDLSGLMLEHNKGCGRAPEGRGLVSLMAGPEAARELVDAPEGEILARVGDAAARYLPELRAATLRTFVHRWPHGIPEATPRALAHRDAFLARDAAPVEYAGDWLMLRPSSEGAVRSAELAAARVLSRLPRTAPSLPGRSR
ncbi:protoporphyrinogen/coproporphyrinogen oxidase [Streptomyces catenulae]|uniref:NAD(P)/FAD-dependent oxidoreductase n=1 Tax=Streptomyces catenulae TaxID=66875 RepID=A0ABV2Z703_9ACTN|nr:NAD(P)/FAD-dependent oxidoreductase [Streptomyces catenulae]